MTSVYGEIAALLTAVCWSFNSVVFTLAGKRVGAVTVNSLRLWIAIPALLLLHWALFGSPFPFEIELCRFVLPGDLRHHRLRYRRRHAVRELSC